MNSTSKKIVELILKIKLINKNLFVFRKSLRLEPPSKNIQQSSSSCNTTNSFCNLESGLASLNVSPAKSSSMRLNAAQSSKFSLGHRKTQSLGSK